MNSNIKKLLVTIAVIAIVLIAGALFLIKDIFDNAQLKQEMTEASTDQSVSERVIDTLIRFTTSDQDGKVFDSDQLVGQVWVAVQTSTADQSTQRLNRIQGVLDAPDDSVAPMRPVRLIAMTKEINGDLQDAAITQLDGKKVGWQTYNASDDPFGNKSACFLIDAYLRVRGVYEIDSDVELMRLKNDVAIVSAEMTERPEGLLNTDWLQERANKQLATVAQFDVRHDFQFRDMQPESGIDFRNKVVDQTARDYVAAHYDHGNGVAIADVDGDGLLDVYFVKQAGRCGLYRNKGDRTFEDITVSAGVYVGDRICVTASFADIDNDGDADLFVSSVRGGNLLFENDGKGKFEDITESAEVGYIGHSSSAIFFDYNRDGLLDLFVTNVGKYTSDKTLRVTREIIANESDSGLSFYTVVEDAFGGHLRQEERGESSILYKNLGENKFADVSKEMNIEDESWTGDAIPVDFNADGWQDLYLLNMQGPDQYYVNVEGKSFQNRTEAVFPKTPWGAMGAKAFDFENDGDMDLFITDMHSDMSQNVDWTREKEKSDIQWPDSFTQTGGNSVWGNAFFRNDGNESFAEISDQINAENYWPWGFSVGDLNADGFQDVFITASMNYPFRYAVNSLYLNSRGEKFLDSEFVLGVEPRRDGKVAEPAFEVIASQEPDHPEVKGRTGRVSVWSSLGSRSSVVYDLDNDGDLDIITNEFNSVPMILVSDLAQQDTPFSFLKIKLVGTKSNRDGLGAVVKVKAADLVQTRIYDGQSGYMSQSAYPLYFGLDKAERVDEVTVVWPSGAKQKVIDVKVGTVVTITESE